MKKILRISLFTLLAVLAMGVVSYAATGGGKHKAKATNAKENKKFVNIVYFTFTGTVPADITNASKWAVATSSLCPSGTAQLCGISFDADQSGYALDPFTGKPNSTVLAIVAGNYPPSPAVHSFTVSGITIYSKP